MTVSNRKTILELVQSVISGRCSSCLSIAYALTSRRQASDTEPSGHRDFTAPVVWTAISILRSCCLKCIRRSRTGDVLYGRCNRTTLACV